MKSLITFFGLACLAQSFAAATIDTVFNKKDSRPSMLAVTSKNLVVARHDLGQIQMISLSDPSDVKVLARGSGFVDLQASRTGWIVACVENGAKVQLFNEQNPKLVNTVVLETITKHVSTPVVSQNGHVESQSPFCGGVDIEVEKGSAKPSVWVSLPGDQAIVKFTQGVLSGLTGTLKLDRVFKNISGPFELRVVGNYIFTANVNVQNPFQALPLVLDKRTGAAVVGNVAGRDELTSLKRSFYTKMYVDPMSRSVIYLNTAYMSFVSISTDAPSESNLKRTPVGIPYMKAVGRYGQCLAVYGQSNDMIRQPLFSILKEDLTSPTGYTVVREILDLQNTIAEGANYFSSDSQGQFYLSSRAGAVRVSHLFDDLDCI